MKTTFALENNYLKQALPLSVLVLALSLLFNTGTLKAEEPSLKEVDFLGLKLINADINKVRTHLWDIGGFLQAKSTVRQRHIDKFFTWSTIRDSYYVEFTYNHSGQLTHLKRLYRPYSTLINNTRYPIKTRDIANQLIEQLGEPTAIKRKGWGGGNSYPSYYWEDENIKITIDREGSEALGKPFVIYQIKGNKRYEVIKDEDTGV